MGFSLKVPSAFKLKNPQTEKQSNIGYSQFFRKQLYSGLWVGAWRLIVVWRFNSCLEKHVLPKSSNISQKFKTWVIFKQENCKKNMWSKYMDLEMTQHSDLLCFYGRFEKRFCYCFSSHSIISEPSMLTISLIFSQFH